MNFFDWIKSKLKRKKYGTFFTDKNGIKRVSLNPITESKYNKTSYTGYSSEPTPNYYGNQSVYDDSVFSPSVMGYDSDRHSSYTDHSTNSHHVDFDGGDFSGSGAGDSYSDSSSDSDSGSSSDD